MLCEKALYKRSAGITVCVSDGNNLCRIKGISGTASSVIKAQDRKRAARRPDDDGTCASGGDTRWTYLELTSTAFCIRLSVTQISTAQSPEISVRSPGTMLRELES